MGLAEVFLLVSVLANWWLYGETQELDTKLEQSIVVAQECQEHLKDSREREIESERQREESDTNIRGVLARSELNTRKFNKMDSDNCGSVPLPSGAQRVEEHIKRTNAVNSEWVRSAGSTDEPKAAP